ncbi:SpoIIE family protein phosphatase [Maribellus maritimus]|uniref:SpoIIE family protein phosphatase n=1 Tax=Maribellus maritimus TaxID=2870838 RepID=UPI001EEC4202|nr:SpoIIE family protein phosphatase [Maribellus maritimus]MCG6189047.1 SpoIIE family protein phosphatase [Maribellus maritimus]
MKKRNLSIKIISRILIFCIGLGTIIFSIYYYYTRAAIQESTRENAVILAENTINQIEEVIEPAEKLPENLAWIIETGVIPKDSLQYFLAQLVKNNPAIYASAIAFEPHIFSENTPAYAPYAFRNGARINTIDLWSPDYNYFIMDWYQIPAILQQPYWSEPYYDEGGAEALLSTYSVPFFMSKEGQQVLGGIITIDISLDWLTEIVNSVKIFDTGYAFLLSRNGVYVTHPNHSQIMNESIFTQAKEMEQPEMREIGRNMIKGQSNLTSLNLKDKGKVWIYYAPIQSTKWSLGVVYPHNEMFESLQNLNIIILLLAFAGLGLLLFFTIKIINQQISPLAKFADSARTIAEGNFNTRLPNAGNSKEMKELHDSFEFMQKELDNYIVNLKETTSAKEKIESELRIAKEIQMGMIPRIFPPFPNLKEIDLFASLESAKEVGGDLYDFFLLDEEHLCFAIGDVSGKGIPASLFMAVTRTLLRSVADNKKSTAEIVGSINKTLSFNNESNMFVTFFLGILEITTGRLRFCNAGHNPPILIKNKTEANFFNITKGIPVGLFEDFNYSEEVVQIEAGDQLFLYTDGLTEAEDKNNKLFEDNHLLDIIRQYAESVPKEIIEKVTKEVSLHVNGHIQSDDLTMMSIIYYGTKK